MPILSESFNRGRLLQATTAVSLPGLLLLFGAHPVRASDEKVIGDAKFRAEVQPVLEEFCYDCHAEGTQKGKVAFDEFESTDQLLGKRNLWLAVLKNVRAGLMPPEKKPHPNVAQKTAIEKWIKAEVFRIDPTDPDPGRVTVRRLNRIEYRNTIRDLMGYDFKVEEELPPDDTGYGFDNIGDVLSVSPMLLEKYMQAAETIVAAAVPHVSHVVAEKTIPPSAWSGAAAEGKRNNGRFSFYDETTLSHSFSAEHAGSYRIGWEFNIDREFAFDPGRCRVVVKVDDRPVWEQEFGSENQARIQQQIDASWGAGEHNLVVEIHPLVPKEQKKNSLDLRLAAFRIEGPTEKEFWARPKNFARFFTRDVPEETAARRDYATEVLRRFALKAFRRPIAETALARLVDMAEATSKEPGKSFEDGIAQAMVPVLASPRFLFRIEESEPSTKAHPFVDEYALASRLSYFLWSTMPDDELFDLARRGELRKNLDAQVKRMLADGRSSALVENFVGQWLQVRDVDGIDINARAVLTRDRGGEREMRETRKRFEELRNKPELTPEEQAEREELLQRFRARFRNRQNIELDGELRRALRQESEMAFAYVVREDRTVRELIECDYTFLNERLAKHYGLSSVPGVGEIQGNDMRRVTLPPESPRGGVLTQGSVLIVTSNPTRTSPVKRGLFILDNILGTPPPPPPPNIPNLEDSEKEFGDHDPTLRETLEVHRKAALCSSCHNRMDPLGFALENFNALGMWRDKERGQSIDASGQLITGEEFQNIRDVKHVIATKYHRGFYECLTEKLLIYALGRGLEYYDVQSVDEIVDRLEKADGRFSALLYGIIESAPFQKRRNVNSPRDSEPKTALNNLPEPKSDE
jgi:hypothetical protein